MATYSLSFAGLEETVQQIGTISTQIEDTLTQLNSGTLRAITEWESGARTEFDNTRAVWSQAASDMVTQAHAAQVALNAIIAEYGNGENYGIKLWNR